ncbi:MAG: hypothetical protein WCO45_18815 [Pseudanabaena sp. ELA607]|jgi:hypothetical protein
MVYLYQTKPMRQIPLVKCLRDVILGTLISLSAFLGGTPAHADEVWQSDYGKVIYQTDRGTTAIWTYGNNLSGTLFIEGLSSELDNRRNYYGYWSQSKAKVRCATYREGRDGKPTYYWGQLSLQFLDRSFPARWSAVFGYCNQVPDLPWRGYPLVGGDETDNLGLP